MHKEDSDFPEHCLDYFQNNEFTTARFAVARTFLHLHKHTKTKIVVVSTYIFHHISKNRNIELIGSEAVNEGVLGIAVPSSTFQFQEIEVFTQINHFLMLSALQLDMLSENFYILRIPNYSRAEIDI